MIFHKPQTKSENDNLFYLNSKLIVKEILLNNGLKVLLSADKNFQYTATVMACDLFHQDFLQRKTGIAHFVEHMTFLRKSRFINRRECFSLSRHSYYFYNAATKEDSILYYSISQPNLLPIMIELEANSIESFDYTKENFNSTKFTILKERKDLIKQQPYFRSLEKLYKYCFKSTVYAKSIIGSSNDIRNIQIADVIDFDRIYSSPSNAVLCVVGDFDYEKVLRVIEDNFKKITMPNLLERGNQTKKLHSNTKRAKVYIIKDHNIKSSAIHIAFKIDTNQNNHSLLILEQILNSNKYMQFNKKLFRKKNNLYNLKIEFIEKRGIAAFIFFMEIDHNICINSVLDDFFYDLSLLKQKLLKSDLFEAKNNAISNLYSKISNPNQRAFYLIEYLLRNENALNIEDEKDKYLNVNIQIIKDSFEKYFNEDNAIIVMTRSVVDR